MLRDPSSILGIVFLLAMIWIIGRPSGGRMDGKLFRWLFVPVVFLSALVHLYEFFMKRKQTHIAPKE